jgi:hypothetical protein
MLRRALGLLTAAFMFHLNVAASDAACTKHAAAHNHAPPAAKMVGMDMTPTSAGNVAAALRGGGPAHQCETPIVPSCCRAMVSCSSVYVGQVRSAISARLQRVDLVRGSIDAPFSRLLAPEPPPPRA